LLKQIHFGQYLELYGPKNANLVMELVSVGRVTWRFRHFIWHCQCS